MEFGLFLLLGAILLVINVTASAAAVRSDYYDRKQKVAQLIMIWLLPIVGGCLVWSIARAPQNKRVTTDLADRIGSGGDDGIGH